MRNITQFFQRIAILLPCAFMPLSAQGQMAQGSTSPELFSAMKHRMSYLGERQAVLSKNIANANTPHYKSVDLTPFDQKTVAAGQQHLRMRVTNSKHLAGNGARYGKFRAVKDKNTFETTIAGNNVSLDEEMKKVAENNLDYLEATNLYKKWSTVMRSAINGRQ